MALTTVDYNSYFNYKLSQKQISFTDKTDFVQQGTLAANVKVLVKVAAPVSGTFYNNTNVGFPDIDCGVSLDSIIPINLPLDGGTDLPEQGEYTIELTYIDSVNVITVVDKRTFILNYESPVVDLTMTVDCITPLLKSVDTTSYTKNLTEPTISRVMEINYPLSMNIAPVTGVANSLSTNEIYVVTGQAVEYSSRLTSNLTYLFDVGRSMYVIDEILGSEFIPVTCDGDLCNIYCAIRFQYQRWQDAKNINTVKANLELAKFEQITSIAEMVGTALKCGKGVHVGEYVAEILKIADADGGCSCDDGTPQLVTGLGAAGSSGVIVEAGTGVSVTSAVNGGVTTYTVALSTDNIIKLANTTNSIVSAGTNTSVSTTTATVGGVSTTTYEVSATDTVAEAIYVRARMLFSASNPPVITLRNQNKYGLEFNTVNQDNSGTNFITNNTGENLSYWNSNFTDFTVNNFAANITDCYPEVQFSTVVRADAKGTVVDLSKIFDVELIDVGSNSFRFRFVKKGTGEAVFGNKLNGSIEYMDLIFKIQA